MPHARCRPAVIDLAGPVIEFDLSDKLVLSNHCRSSLVPIYAQGSLDDSAICLDKALNGLTQTLIERRLVTCIRGEINIIPVTHSSVLDYLIFLGMGEREPLSDSDYRKFVVQTFESLRDITTETVESYLTEVMVIDRDEDWKVRTQIEIAGQVLYQTNHFKSVKAEKACVRRVIIQSPNNCDDARFQGAAIVEACNDCRDLGNLPGNICTPRYMAARGQDLARKYSRLSTTVLDEKQMDTLGMHALLSVGKGSVQESTLTVMRYLGAGDDEPPYVFIGKGITFDTGGISIKNREAMIPMKYDMGGAAAVLGVMTAIVRLQLPINLVGVMACAENMPSGSASKPSDIVTSMSGKTVEILNTDAEGRLVLCDALSYVERFSPRVVIDIATLTGASTVALGHHYSALFSNDDDLAAELISAGTSAGDKAWRLPLSAEDMPQLNSDFADIANASFGSAGAIVAALFLSQFAQNYTWAHLDVSGTAKTVTPKRSATARPVRLLIHYLINVCKKAK